MSIENKGKIPIDRSLIRKRPILSLSSGIEGTVPVVPKKSSSSTSLGRMPIIQLKEGSEGSIPSTTGKGQEKKPQTSLKNFVELPPNFVARRPLVPREFRAIRSELRPEGKEPAFIVPPKGADLVSFLKEELTQRRIPLKLLERHIDRERVPLALKTGTDRNNSSRIGRSGKTQEAMIRYGLDPNKDKGMVTFAFPLDLSRKDENIRFMGSSDVILLYSPDALTYLDRDSNLVMFKDPRLIQPSLLAVVSPVPQSEVLRQSKG